MPVLLYGTVISQKIQFCFTILSQVYVPGNEQSESRTLQPGQPYSLEVLQLSLDVSLESSVCVAVYFRVFMS